MNGDGDGDLLLSNIKVLSVLGRGGKGVVFLVRAAAEQLVALKVVSKSFLIQKKKNGDDGDGMVHDRDDGSEYKRICFERDVLKQFDHPLLPKLRGVFSTDSVVGYAIDYCSGRNLNYLRKNQTEHMFSDNIIRFYAAELVLALEYLHGLGIVYRDLKPENVMIQENGHLMLVDFDLSTKLSVKSPGESSPIVRGSVANSQPVKKKRSFFRCGGDPGISPDNDDSASQTEPVSVSRSNSFVGTEEYVAPEMILGTGHDFAVDWWSLGVVLYEMLYGATPFRGINRKETFYRILSMTPKLVGEATPLRDLIGKLLNKEAKQRISVAEIKGHDFFKGMDWDSVMYLSRPPYIPCEDNFGDLDGIREINMELLVEEIFGEGEKSKFKANDIIDSNNDTTVNNGDWGKT